MNQNKVYICPICGDSKRIFYDKIKKRWYCCNHSKWSSEEIIPLATPQVKENLYVEV